MVQKPLVLLVDDQPENLDVLVNYLAGEGLDLLVATDGEQALSIAKENQPQLVLLDVMMPGMDGFEVCKQLRASSKYGKALVIFMSALTDTASKLKGFEAGAIDYVNKPLQREEVLARIRAHLTIQRQQAELVQKNTTLKSLNDELHKQIHQREQAEQALQLADKRLSALTQEEAKRWGIEAFVGQSPAIKGLLNEVRGLLAAPNTNVLVLGESGTGKELISRSIHFGSARKNKPFIAVNCSAIPSELADAEFFGHVKGAFTGALKDRSGFFVQADGGTLFLDEIGDMPLTLQAKLLRVLEDGIVTPVGSSKSRKVDVRVVAATNVNLISCVQEKSFRQDLFYRLASYQLTLPPLRQRSQDIPLLVDHFLDQLSGQMGRGKPQVSHSANQALLAYSYPGNVRELKNLLEYALISSQGGEINPSNLHFVMLENTTQTLEMTTNLSSPLPEEPNILVTEQQECELLEHVKSHGKVDNGTAQACLGVEHGRASYLLKKLHREGHLVKHGERRWTYYQLP